LPAVHQTALLQTVRKDLLDRGDQPGRAVTYDQQRWPQPAGDQATQESQAGIVGFGAGAVQREEHRLATGGDAPGNQHWLSPRPLVVAKVRRINIQKFQLNG
jgi:hypothetical protein